MKTLHLTVTRNWFDKIASGEKTEDFREMKQYWQKRLFRFVDSPFYTFKEFENVAITAGYGYDKPTITAKCTGIRITAEDEKTDLGTGRFFAIGIGEIIERKNL